MKKTEYLLWLGVGLSAGAALGLLSDRRKPAKGGLMGAAAGVIAGAAAAGMFAYVSAEKVPYYSNSSDLYDETDAV